MNKRRRPTPLVWSASVYLLYLLVLPSVALAADCSVLADCLPTSEAAARAILGLVLAIAAAPYLIRGLVARLPPGDALRVGGIWAAKSRIAMVAASVLGRLLGQLTSRGLGRTIVLSEKQLQKKFKHSADFGVIGKFTSANAARLERAIISHVKDRATVPLVGTYGDKAVTHFFNQKTGLNVMRNLDGTFRSGWKLSAEQVEHLLKFKKLGGE